MKRNVLMGGLGALAAVAASLGGYVARTCSENRAGHHQSPVQKRPQVLTVQGSPIVAISWALQTQAGIRTRVLVHARYRPQAHAYGLILDPRPLLALRTRYATALGRVGVVRAVAAASQQEYKRLRLLNRDERNVSLKTVQAAQAVYRSDQARLTAALANAANLRQLTRTQWGSVLAHWMLNNTRGPLTRLFDGEDALLQVTLPPGLILPTMPPLVAIESGQSSPPINARFVSASPRSDPNIQGETYFYLMPARHIRIGMRVPVDVPLARAAIPGVVVPESAVLWYANRAWVYGQTSAGRFVRYRVATQHPVPGGWFETDLKPGERVVTRGAELLLSQELLAPPAGAKERDGQKGSGDRGTDDDHDNDSD